jgi:hypothetical protein
LLYSIISNNFGLLDQRSLFSIEERYFKAAKKTFSSKLNVKDLVEGEIQV